ncbi:lipopolysaccharide assembly protein LapA domain-containing protein [Blastococcus sp. URHD0036]|uniref:lipopolysaccharide assembly protein LapA domain-containing protein n=1 Tax=Blastococcus sp. URHD0036 TaxID=1380356 RepID=UPI000496614B|nr:LapA family protein [Blastococcus sp. URHD0036]
MVQQSPPPAGPTGPAGGPGPAPATKSGLSAGVVSTLLGGGLLVVFIVQNRNDVRFDFLWWGFTWPLWLYTIVTATLGAVVWIGLGILRRHRRRVARRAARRDEFDD